MIVVVVSISASWRSCARATRACSARAAEARLLTSSVVWSSRRSRIRTTCACSTARRARCTATARTPARACDTRDSATGRRPHAWRRRATARTCRRLRRRRSVTSWGLAAARNSMSITPCRLHWYWRHWRTWACRLHRVDYTGADVTGVRELVDYTVSITLVLTSLTFVTLLNEKHWAIMGKHWTIMGNIGRPLELLKVDIWADCDTVYRRRAFCYEISIVGCVRRWRKPKQMSRYSKRNSEPERIMLVAGYYVALMPRCMMGTRRNGSPHCDNDTTSAMTSKVVPVKLFLRLYNMNTLGYVVMRSPKVIYKLHVLMINISFSLVFYSCYSLFYMMLQLGFLLYLSAFVTIHWSVYRMNVMANVGNTRLHSVLSCFMLHVTPMHKH